MTKILPAFRNQWNIFKLEMHNLCVFIHVYGSAFVTTSISIEEYVCRVIVNKNAGLDLIILQSVCFFFFFRRFLKRFFAKRDL
jgi:hypothetical protein